MPFAVKKPHPQHSNVKVWHSWDPDGDGYEEIRKFKTKERAQQWVDENHPTKNCEIVEIAYEIGQDDDEIERKNLADTKRSNDCRLSAGDRDRLGG